ncbi:MAG: hypothetical protein IKA96_08345 [Alistipes sp.]|nr:hypothetical protein [Alistipes sp.]MBR7167601.1 hypothetical protein [Bacteroidales bacterium]
MSTFEIIVSVATIVGVVFSIWTSKWCIRRRIERKQNRIQNIETARFKKYRANRPIFGMDKLDWKEKQLQEDIDELRKDL